MHNMAGGNGAGTLLRMIRGGEATTRASLARRTGLARSTVAQRVDALLAHALVYEAGQRSTGGRPADRARVQTTRRASCSSPMGATHSRLAVTDLAGRAAGRGGAASSTSTPTRRRCLGEIDTHLRALRREGSRGAAAGARHRHRRARAGRVRDGRPVSPPIMPAGTASRSRPWFERAPRRAGPGRQRRQHHGAGRALDELGAAPSTCSSSRSAPASAAAAIVGGMIHRGARGAAGDIGHIRRDERRGGALRLRQRQLPGGGRRRARGRCAGSTALGLDAANSRDVVALVRRRPAAGRCARARGGPPDRRGAGRLREPAQPGRSSSSGAISPRPTSSCSPASADHLPALDAAGDADAADGGEPAGRPGGHHRRGDHGDRAHPRARGDRSLAASGAHDTAGEQEGHGGRRRVRARGGVAGPAAAPAAKRAKPKVLIVTASEGKRDGLARLAERRLVAAARSEGLRPVRVRKPRGPDRAPRPPRRRGRVRRRRGDGARARRRGRAQPARPPRRRASCSRLGRPPAAALAGLRRRWSAPSPPATDAPKTAQVQFVDRVHPSSVLVPRRWKVDRAVGHAQEEPDRARARARLGRREELQARTRSSAMGVEHPVSWCRELGDGRSFTTTLGLTPRDVEVEGLPPPPRRRDRLRRRHAQRRLRRDDLVELEADGDRRGHHRRHAARRRARRPRLLPRAQPLAAEDLRPRQGHRHGGGRDPVGARGSGRACSGSRWTRTSTRTAGCTSTATSRASTPTSRASRSARTTRSTSPPRRCCSTSQNKGVDHNGGGLAMRSNGDLYLATATTACPTSTASTGRATRPRSARPLQIDSEQHDAEHDELPRQGAADPSRAGRDLHDPARGTCSRRGRRRRGPRS